MAEVRLIVEVSKLVAKMAQQAAKYNKNPKASVVVGYTASYALWVHENLQAAHGQDFNTKWAAKIAATKKMRKAGKAVGHSPWHSRGPDQQAKFLEQPARQFAKEIGQLVVNALRAGRTMAQALLLGGLKLQRESQRIVPVDTGALKSSAFTSLE